MTGTLLARERDAEASTTPRHPRPLLRTLAGTALAIGAACAMGGAVPAQKLMWADGLSTLNVVQVRSVTGAITLMGLALSLRHGRVRIARSHWPVVAAYGAVGMALNQIVFAVSLTRLSVGVALLLEYLAPLVVAAWVRFGQGREVHRLVWIGAGLALVGLALVAQIGHQASVGAVGLAFGLVAAITMASKFLITESALRRLDPLLVVAWGAIASASLNVLTCVVDPFPVHLLAHAAHAPEGGLPLIVLIAWVGIVATAGGMLLTIFAQGLLPPTSTSLLLTLEVVAGSVVAYAMLGESFDPVQIIGGAIMLAGIGAATVGVVMRPHTARPDMTSARPSGSTPSPTRRTWRRHGIGRPLARPFLLCNSLAAEPRLHDHAGVDDQGRLLAAYDAQLRTDAETPSAVSVALLGPLRLVTFSGGRGFVTYEHLQAVDAGDLDELVDGVLAHFRADPEITRVEWKARAHDQVPGLRESLLAHGFVAMDTRSIMIGEAERLAVEVPLDDGVTLRQVKDESDVRAMCAMTARAFDISEGHATEIADALLRRQSRDDGMELWVAEHDRQMVAAGRLEPVSGTDFAGIWGGSTLPEWRGRGIYRALTSVRARTALLQGKTLIHSDSSDYSRPILERYGFIKVSEVHPYTWYR